MAIMDDIIEFVQHYADNDGHIKDLKYKDKDCPQRIKDKWMPLVRVLDSYRQKLAREKKALPI